MNPFNILVFLSLGSNLGDREDLLKRARERIKVVVGRINKQSSIYETVPWGMEGSEPFLNQVIQVTSLLRPVELLRIVQEIEEKLGRKRDTRNTMRDTGYAMRNTESRITNPGSRIFLQRPIDIDILFYGAESLDMPDLKIPHPLIPERRFVLEPLAEIAGEFVHPILGKPVNELLAICMDTNRVKVFSKTSQK